MLPPVTQAGETLANKKSLETAGQLIELNVELTAERSRR